MKRYTLPVKVVILMMLAVGIVSAAGYLTYKNLSLIVASIEVKSRPDMRLFTIREIASDLSKAENSVRMYRLTRKQDDIAPYYSIIGGIDDKIDSLRSASLNDTTLQYQIDTISMLIEENMLVWNEIIDLYHTDSLEIYVRKLTGKIAVNTLNEKDTHKSILKRVFSRKALKAEAEMAQQAEQKARQEIISDLNRIEQHETYTNSLMLEKESKLAITGDEIRERLYTLISRMEHEVIDSLKANADNADQLAKKTYKWLALFALVATLLIISVIFVVVRFVRKTFEYHEALEKSREATEKLAKTKELFIANMSHEIRTPVNAIYGFSEQLLHEPMQGKSRKMLEIVKSNSKHLVRIVNDILDFSKLQHASLDLEKKHFLLQPLLEEVKIMLSPRAKENKTQLTYFIGQNTPQILFGDSHRLKQILINLTGNAAKFTHNGQISITANASGFSGNSFDLILTVIDNGIGIKKEMHEKVFEDFTQAEAGTSRVYGGTGLGLSIVKKLVELHSGTIHLDSEENRGTKITCILPYETGDIKFIQADSPALILPDNIHGLKVLVADDEEYNRMLFRTIFSRWELKFEEAMDGSDAISKIKSDHYDLIFMDVRMPGIDGIDAAKLIRQQLGLSEQRLPVIGTSATHSSQDVQIYLSSGMNAFLPKPFTEKMLLDVMTAVINNTEKPDGIEFSDDHLPSGSDDMVDLRNLYHLANNDVTFVKLLVSSFIDSTEKGLNGLQEAANTGDFQTIHEIAHRISSPCRHLGAANLYSRLKMIEEQAKNNENIDILVKLSNETSSEFFKIKNGLQKHLEEL